MIAGLDLVSLFERYFQAVLFGLIALGMLEGIFYLRYGGNWVKRGVMVWNQALGDDEWNFLSKQQEDIYEEIKTKRLWYKAKSFVMIRDRHALIRYGNPRQNTSWPMVGYVDLSNEERVLELRMPISMLLLVLWIVIFGLIKEVYLFSGIFLAIFAISFFLEYIGLRDYLKRRTEIFTTRQFPSRQNWNE